MVAGAMVIGAVGGYVAQVAQNMSAGMSFGDALVTDISATPILRGAAIAGIGVTAAISGGVALGVGVTSISTLGQGLCADGDCANEIKATGDLVDKGFGNLTNAAQNGIGTYMEHRQFTVGTGLQIHHLIETRFANILKLSNIQLRNMPSIILTPREHQMFTNQWRSLIGYTNSSAIFNTNTSTYKEIYSALERVYQDYPALLKASQQFLESLQ